jgi:hypothetical protein
MVKQAQLGFIENEAIKALTYDPNKKSLTKTSLLYKYNQILNSGTSCELNYNKAKVAIANL